MSSEEKRLDLFVRILVLGFLASIAFSKSLWLSGRLYPLIPFADLVPAFPYPVDLLFLVTLGTSLAILFVWPRSRAALIASLAVLGVLFLQDTNRLWPSFYEYTLLLFAVLISYSRSGAAHASSALTLCRFIVGAVYFWSGFQKLTSSFFSGQFPWFIEPITNVVQIPHDLVLILGVSAAVLEVLMGISLLFKRFQNLGLIEVMLMHLLIFFLIGPFRGNWNDSAWIWSNVSALLALVLFYKAPPVDWKALLTPRKSFAYLPTCIVLVFIGVMPLLNNINAWPSPLSFNIYTGNVHSAKLSMDAQLLESLPQELQTYANKRGEKVYFDMNRWSADVFNANPVPETRTFKAIAERLCSYSAEGMVELTITSKSSWFKDRSEEQYTCKDFVGTES